MINDYLKKQNKFLLWFSGFLFIIALFFAIFISIKGHIIFAIFQFSIILGFVSGIIKVMVDNTNYINKWDAISEIEMDAYPIEDGSAIDIMRTKVGNLNFKFTKD